MKKNAKCHASLVWLLAAVVAACLFVLLFVIHAITLRACDDFLYSLFWRDGLGGFLQKNVEHYIHINGRVFVHLVCQTVLTLGRPVFAAVALVIYAILCRLIHSFLGTPWEKPSPRLYIASCLSFALLFMLMSQRMVLGKAVLWISSFFNYIFPTFFIVCTMVFLRRKEKLGPGGMTLGLLMSFLCGATTEQSGVLALVLLGCFWLEEVALRRRPGWRRLAFVAAAAAGYLSVFLSPATRHRAERDVGLDLVWNTFGRIAVNTVSLHRSLALLVAFSLAMYFFARLNPKAPKGNRIFLPVGLALLISGFLPSAIGLCSAMLALFLTALVITAVGWIFRSPYKMAGYFQLAIVCSLLIMPITNNAAVRISLPLVFGVLLLAVWMISQMLVFYLPLAGRKCRVSMAAWSALGVVAALVIFLPTFGSFLANYRMEQQNMAAMQEALQTGRLQYCTDYDDRCSYTQINHDNFALKHFRILYGLEDTEIEFYSRSGTATATDYYLLHDVAGSHDVIVQRNGILYAALRSAVTSCGGWSCREECDHVDFTLNGRSYVFSDGWLYDGRRWTCLGQEALIYGNNTYLPVELLTQLLEIEFDFSQELVTCHLAS